MEIPTCYRCHKELPDFDAKVMTDLPNWLNRPGVVMWVRPYCHECVSYLDQNEDGRNKYHQLWNLKDIARSPMIYFGQVILKATEEDSEGPPSKRWTAQAVRDMVDIVVMCLPDYFALDLMKGFFDWNLESERADALGERIQEQATADNLVAKTEPGAYLHALTEDEIRLLLVKMLDLYYFTRGLLVNTDFSDPQRSSLFPDWLRTLDKALGEATQYRREKYPMQSDPKVIHSR